jgi:hypothetical protein
VFCARRRALHCARPRCTVLREPLRGMRLAMPRAVAAPRACAAPPPVLPQRTPSRRVALLCGAAAPLCLPGRTVAATLATGGAAAAVPLPAGGATADVASFAAAALEACNDRNFGAAEALYTQLLALDAPAAAPRWLEARADARVDGKAFAAARRDYSSALAACADEPPGREASQRRARLLAGDALAAEGLADWAEALALYDTSLATADAAAAFRPPLARDPYTLNARGNVLGSLGRWAEARDGYAAR